MFSEAEFVCFKGTWGCGKSLAALLAANYECEQHPNNLYLITRKEWVDLRDSTIHDWLEILRRPLDGNKNVKYSNGSVLMFRHGADLNSLKNTNLGGALMIQAEEESEDTLWFLKGRLRRPNGTRQLRLECNYDGHNWIYNLFNEQKVGQLVTTNTFDNEANLPTDYIEGLKKLPKRLQERYLYGSDADSEGLVYDEFRRNRDIVEPFEIPATWKRSFGLDHGFRNPTAVIWYAVDFDGNLVFFDEYYQKERPVSYHAGQIKTRGLLQGLCDPSVLAKTQSRKETIYSIADEYKDNGIILTPAFKSREHASINRVNEYFKEGRIKIFANCTNLIKEIENWKWKSLRPGINRNDPEEPMDKDNHGADVIKYVVASRQKSVKPPQPPPPQCSVAAIMERQEVAANDWRSKYR